MDPFHKTLKQPASIYQQLCEPENYIPIIDRKYLQLIQDPSFAIYMQNCKTSADIAVKISNELKNKDYLPGLAKPLEIKKKGKIRTVYSLPLKDRLIINVLTKALFSYHSDSDCQCVYSYIPGRHFMQAIQSFSSYLKRTLKNHQQDLYLIRSDFKNYTDTIPINNHSIVWKQIAEMFLRDPSIEGSDYVWALIQSAIRPLIQLKEGAVCQRIIGLLTGSPFTALVANLYPQKIDQYLIGQKGGFYARFGDDLIFAHPDPDLVLEANKKLSEMSKELGLVRHSGKDQLAYLTCCGKKNLKWPQFRGVESIHFLGCRIDAKGAIGASQANVKGLLRNVKRRLDSAACLLKKTSKWRESIDDLNIYAQIINQILSPTSNVSDNNITTILKKSNDRNQLRAIDRHILFILAEKTLNQRGRKVLRTLPYKKILAQTSIVSLQRLKNRDFSEDTFKIKKMSGMT